MKDQYVADINDFVKYGLLRRVGRRHELFVCWMLTPPDGRRDGRSVGYLLEPGPYRALDPDLFDELSALVRSGKRSVREVESAGFLPTVGSLAGLLLDAPAARERYFAGLWGVVGSERVLFFDPDNGLDVPSIRRGVRGSARYLYRTELQAAVMRGHSVIVYQHFPRVPRRPFVQQLLLELRELATPFESVALYTSRVAFLVVINKEAHPRLRRELLTHAARWGGVVSVEECRGAQDFSPDRAVGA